MDVHRNEQVDPTQIAISPTLLATAGEVIGIRRLFRSSANARFWPIVLQSRFALVLKNSEGYSTLV